MSNKPKLSVLERYIYVSLGSLLTFSYLSNATMNDPYAFNSVQHSFRLVIVMIIIGSFLQPVIYNIIALRQARRILKVKNLAAYKKLTVVLFMYKLRVVELLIVCVILLFKITDIFLETLTKII